MTLSQLLLKRQLFGNCLNQKQMLSSVIESHPLICDYMENMNSTINYMDIDSIDYKFLLIGYNEGYVSINEILDPNSGHFNKLFNIKIESAVNRCQWYPIDSGMFSITSTDCITLIDTNRMKQIDKYRFPNCQLYWSDWNSNNSSTIAVGCSSSAIRIIDIRNGSSAQQLTLSSMTGTAHHNITRILWSPLDSDCLIAGDSSGYLHIYDIRRPNRVIRVFGSDYTSFQPISCLTFTKDKTSLLTCHGVSNKLNLWHFKRSDLINSDINFQCPIIRSKERKSNMNSSYIRCQLFVTDDYVFTPNNQKQFGKDVLSYQISTGMKAHSLSTSKEGSFSSLGPNCVTGLDNGSLLLYSGGNKRLCVWTPTINYEPNNGHIRECHVDRWSDSE